jgi:ferredoxin--NADP+ reductase
MGYKILYKKHLSPDTVLMRVEAPRVARAARPGQFVIVRVADEGERIPLTIAGYDAAEGWVEIVTQTVGATTRRLNAMAEGDSIIDFVGPLGRPSEFVHLGESELRGKRFLFVAGGVGAAPVLPQAKWLHERGVAVDVIIGARTAGLLILTDEMRAACDNLHLATDDGSTGFHGLVTDLMKKLIETDGRTYDQVVTIGPMVMMKFVTRTAAAYNLPAVASLNTLMVDGTGMCGACRVSVGGKTYFACVDGPEFDAHEVDFDEAIRRQSIYREFEVEADHKCKIGLVREQKSEE